MIFRLRSDNILKKLGGAKSAGLILLALAFAPGLHGCSGGGGTGRENSGEHSIARVWDEAALDAIRIDTPRPPVHARNLWHMSAAMYDAWAVYDQTSDGYQLREKISVPADQLKAARQEAISFAAYRVLKNRYALSANSAATLAALDAKMAELGYDIEFFGIEGDSPAAVGNRAAAAIIALGESDGSNQAVNYVDPTYTPVNSPLVVAFPGNQMTDPNAWQPLALAVSFTQNGIRQPSGLQSFVGSQWNNVTPFALTRAQSGDPYIDPGPPPRVGGAGDGQFKSEMLDLVRLSSELSPDLPAEVDISPAGYGNNPLGSDAGTGRSVNPVTGEPYESEVVKLGDFGRVLAEFWADGPNSETPPGHWNTIANGVSDSGFQNFQFEGGGEPLDRLEWDVKLYFVLNGALHDAAVNCWGLKRIYNSVRPISAIRLMATKGQSSDPRLPSYNPAGLPLVAGLSELITGDSWPTGRHAGIRCCVDASANPAPCVDSTGTPGVEVSCVGEVAVLSWPGSPAAPSASFSGVKWIRAKEWAPFQLSTFVTPAFPGYTSGHSTFSRAAAEVLTAFTGSEFFPGGLGGYSVNKDAFLRFEQGPSSDLKLEWATYYDAADQAGLSRRFGGIHIQSDDYAGRITGSAVGKEAFVKAKAYFDGTAVISTP